MKKQIIPLGLFSSFMFLQFVILRMGNQAGRGFLSAEMQEYVYVFLQLFAIGGIAAYVLLKTVLDQSSVARILPLCALGLCLPCAGVMLFAPTGSVFYLTVTFLAVFCVGIIAGAVYLRMALYGAAGYKTGLCMGAGYSAALLAQFLFQLQWLIKPVLAVLLAASAAGLVLLLARDGQAAGAGEEQKPVSGKYIASVSVISVALLFFTAFYCGYITHLQTASGYGEYNVYTWPRLLMIPSMLFFGAAGDYKKGKYLPLLSLCFSVVALLNALLVGKSDLYWLNMCLYYIALSAAVSYYNLTFWKLAPRTKHPAVWAVAGRVFDSIVVIPLCLVSLSDGSAASILALNIGALVVVILLMAANGSFSFLPEKKESAALLPDQLLSDIQTRYGLSDSETKVFRELVLTEDKQTVISDRLSVSVRTMQANVTSIYKKTGVATRSGLVHIYQTAQK